MKRLITSTEGQEASAVAIREATMAASRAWSAEERKTREAKRRKHRRLTEEERDAKKLRTAQAKAARQAQREAREHDRMMRRLRYMVLIHLKRTEACERKIKVVYRPGTEPRFKVTCPRSLYRRARSVRPSAAGKPGRVASDGMRNLVLRASPRGFGKKRPGTRAYSAGEAGRASRYIARIDGIESVEGAVVTNVLTGSCERMSGISVERQQRVTAFYDALEHVEKSCGDSHVYCHWVLALPSELSPEGRATFLARLGETFDRMRLPFTAALHKPDPEGDHRNFHAHILLAARRFEVESEFAWSFDAGKFTEMTSKAWLRQFRKMVAEKVNIELGEERNGIRYSHLSQADRGLTPADDVHKGQKATALERKERKHREKALSLVNRALAELAEIKAWLDAQAKQDEGRERSRLIVEKTPEEVSDVARNMTVATPSTAGLEALREHDAAVGRQREGGSEAKKPAVARKVVVDSISYQIPYEKRTEAFAILVNELGKEPQTLAMVERDGALQFAYVNSKVEGALRQAISDPVLYHWLKGLTTRLVFDHASVAPSWSQAHVRLNGYFHQHPAAHWAAFFGGVRNEQDNGFSHQQKDGFER